MCRMENILNDTADFWRAQKKIAPIKRINVKKLCDHLKNYQNDLHGLNDSMGRFLCINDGPIIGQPVKCFEFLLNGKCELRKFKDIDFKKAMGSFVISIVHSKSIYCTTLSLRYLSEMCQDVGQYVVALRFLNIAYSLCTMYDYEYTITFSFVSKYYFKYKRQIKKNLKKIVCSFCGSKGKVKSCTNCMAAFYCSKLCQKRDWMSHRKKCHKVWSGYYQMLKRIS